MNEMLSEIVINVINGFFQVNSRIMMCLYKTHTLFFPHQVSRPDIDLQLKATDRSHIRARPNRRTEWQQVLRMTAGACSNLVNRFIAAF